MASLPAFRPTSVKRLTSGHYLITNAVTATNSLFKSGRFSGEVFEIDPLKNYANFSVPAITTVRDANNVIIGLDQKMGNTSGSGNTGILEQPLFADRLF